jgi:tetraacyldisaccharide 4'-kinase
LLREPVASLARADTIVLTRCDQVSASELSLIRRRLADASPDAVVLQCRHRVMAVERIDGTVIGESLSGARALLMTAIGNPSSLETTAASLGIAMTHRAFRSDHHRYRRTDVEDALRHVRGGVCDIVLTSEKDAVKLAALGGYERAPIAVVRVAIDFLEDDGTLFERKLSAVMGRGRR